MADEVRHTAVELRSTERGEKERGVGGDAPSAAGSCSRQRPPPRPHRTRSHSTLGRRRLFLETVDVAHDGVHALRVGPDHPHGTAFRRPDPEFVTHGEGERLRGVVATDPRPPGVPPIVRLDDDPEAPGVLGGEAVARGVPDSVGRFGGKSLVLGTHLRFVDVAAGRPGTVPEGETAGERGGPGDEEGTAVHVRPSGRFPKALWVDTSSRAGAGRPLAQRPDSGGRFSRTLARGKQQA